jgi:hypothetical protein
LRGSLILALLALSFVLGSFSMLATSPQNPDGAEMVLTAVQGGVLHPPGYPLQSWLDRAVMEIGATTFVAGPDLAQIATPTWLLSLQSLVCFSGALFFLGLALLELGAELGGACFGVVCFALYPPAWQLAVQPEKYALMFLLIAAFAFFATSVNRLAQSWFLKTIALAVLFGLIMGQHIVGLVALPLLLVFGSEISRRRRFWAGLVFAIVAVMVSGGLYLSLLSLTREGVWPDWGKLHSVSDVLAHVSRRDLGLFTVDPNQRDGIRAITIAFSDLWSTFSVALFFLPVGIWAAWSRTQNKKGVAWGLALAASIIFVIKAQSGGYPEVAVTWLERYTAVPMFFLSGVFALGWDQVVRLTAKMTRSSKMVRCGSPIAIAALAAVLALRGQSTADASTDATLDLYSRALAEVLPESAVYIGGCNDLEYFYGAAIGATYSTSGGLFVGANRRFPICGEYEWYRKQVIPLLEPRLSVVSPFHKGLFEFESAQKAFATGFPVYSTNLELLEGIGPKPVRRGLLWMIDPEKSADSGAKTLEATVSLCSLLKELTFDPPKKGHYYSQFLWQQIALAFKDASEELAQDHAVSEAKKTEEIAYVVLRSSQASVIRSSCQGFLGSLDEPREGR